MYIKTTERESALLVALNYTVNALRDCAEKVDGPDFWDKGGDGYIALMVATKTIKKLEG